MFRENLAALFLLYIRPVAAVSRMIDQGRLWFAILAAVAVSFLLHASDSVPRAPIAMPLAIAALLRFISYTPGSYFAAIMAVAIILAPAVILCRALFGFGSFSVLMGSEYLPLLVCMLTSWAAAYLPLALVRVFTGLDAPALYLASNLYFAVLAALSARTVFGTGLGSALYFLMSPIFLFYAYMIFGSNVRSLGEGLRSRQHLREQLEIATNNPRDSDAHYQLGLIYQKRRQYTEALARFQRAVEIDPTEADAHMQLGRIAREQGRFEDAIRHLKIAASLDDKLALSDVWRELGAAYFGASRLDEAAAALAKYTDRRAYDPEGLYWYGKTLLQLDRPAEARELFERSIEAVKTMPSNRRAQVRAWGSRARAELRTLKR
jgi:tetratricopeptide (TPR) repeat protein